MALFSLYFGVLTSMARFSADIYYEYTVNDWTLIGTWLSNDRIMLLALL